MAQPIRRSYTAVRAYSDTLRDLMSQLAADPLDERKSEALVAHIVNNRSFAADQYRTLEEAAAGLPC